MSPSRATSQPAASFAGCFQRLRQLVGAGGSVAALNALRPQAQARQLAAGTKFYPFFTAREKKVADWNTRTTMVNISRRPASIANE